MPESTHFSSPTNDYNNDDQEIAEEEELTSNARRCSHSSYFFLSPVHIQEPISVLQKMKKHEMQAVPCIQGTLFLLFLYKSNILYLSARRLLDTFLAKATLFCNQIYVPQVQIPLVVDITNCTVT